MPRAKHLDVFEAGAVFGFPTERLFDWHPETTGRFGALKILGEAKGDVLVAVPLDWISTTMPTVDDVREAAMLRSERFAFRGRPCTLGGSYPTAAEAAELTFVGRIPLTEPEQHELDTLRSYGGLVGLSRKLSGTGARIELRSRRTTTGSSASGSKPEPLPRSGTRPASRG